MKALADVLIIDFEYWLGLCGRVLLYAVHRIDIEIRSEMDLYI